MRFGLDYHKHVIPEWEKNYVDYNRLKRLMKSPSLPGALPGFAEAYNLLYETTTQINTFRQNQDALLKKRGEELWVLFGPGQTANGFPTGEQFEAGGFPIGAQLDRVELEHLLDTHEEIRRLLARLQWFDRVNSDAFQGILAKLERCGQTDTDHHRRVKSRWLQMAFFREAARRENTERLDDIIDNVREALLWPFLGTRSLYLKRVWRQYLGLETEIRVIYETLRDDNADDLIRHLRSMNGPSWLNFGAFVDEIFQYSILHKSNRSAAGLLSDTELNRWLNIDNDCLNTFTRAHKPRAPTGPPGLAELADRRLRTAALWDNDFASADLLDRMLRHIGTGVIDVLQTEDQFGRLPLHHAAQCHHMGIIVLEFEALMRFQEQGIIATTILSADNERLTPLHYALLRGHEQFLMFFIDLATACDADPNRYRAGTVMAEILFMSLRYEHVSEPCIAEIIQRANIQHMVRGETALHIAAQFGRYDFAALLARKMTQAGVDIDIPDTARLRTPLFEACARGHLDIAKLFLELGASQSRTDYLAWTAKERAAYHGHLSVAELFDPPPYAGAESLGRCLSLHATVPLDGSPSRPDKVLIVNLDCGRKGIEEAAVRLDFCSSEHLSGIYREHTYKLVISVPGSDTSRRVLWLPILDDRSYKPFMFSIADGTQPRLIFKIFRPKMGTSGDGIVVGTGAAFLKDEQLQLGAQRQTLTREHTVAVINPETINIVGTITFTYVIAKPLRHLQNPQYTAWFRATGDPVPIVGHREGLGQNVASREFLQLGENTVMSFLSAVKLGASFVEFDVQVTRDLKAVIYHDFSFSESGTDIPIHDLTLKQYKSASNLRAPHGDRVSLPTETGSGREVTRSRHRARSLDRGFEAGAEQAVQQRMRYTVDFQKKGFKPNTRGTFIQDSYTTLQELLVKLPEEIGFFAEIKYPRLHEATEAGVASIAIDMNTFVDVALENVRRHGGKRPIILSSSTPEICILLSMKQKAYPVMFIADLGKVPAEGIETRAASLQTAIHFARRWGLAGLMLACEPLLLCPRLIQFVKDSGLVCVSYGLLNNQPEHAKTQANAGIDLFMTDRVGLIAKALNG